jgi:AraC-like DNA-binding protein/quercetin dioxygenase-like cupin family protein
MRRLRFKDLLPLSAGCHVARSFYHPGHASGRHGHDFAEAMWVEMGAVRHDTGRSVRLLTTGDIVLVRPHHQHDIRGVDDQIGVIVNIAFPASVLNTLESYYDCAALWGDEHEPRVRRLSTEDIAALGRRIETLRTGPDDRLARDAFLTTLLDRLRPRQADLWRNAPAWLAGPLSRCAEPPLLSAGLSALVRLSKRSREHISRSIRAATGDTPTALLTEMRLRWAERQLALTDTPISAIAAACGIGRARLGHLFTIRHGRSPRAYRMACRGAVG